MRLVNHTALHGRDLRRLIVQRGRALGVPAVRLERLVVEVVDGPVTSPSLLVNASVAGLHGRIAVAPPAAWPHLLGLGVVEVIGQLDDPDRVPARVVEAVATGIDFVLNQAFAVPRRTGEVSRPRAGVLPGVRIRSAQGARGAIGA